MGEPGLSSLFMWSIVTGIAILVIGFSYRMYLKRHSDEIKDEHDVDTATIPHTTTTIDISNDDYAIDTTSPTEEQPPLSSDTMSKPSSDITHETSLDISSSSSNTQNDSLVVDTSDNSSASRNANDAEITPTKSEQTDD